MDGQPRASEARSFLPPAAFRMLRSHEPPSRPWAPGSRLRRSRLAHSARRLDRGWPARLQRRVPPQPLRRGGVAADAQPAGRGAGPFPRAHRVGRQWRVAWAHVRRAPRWVLGAGALLTMVSVAARALILPALAWGMPDRPPFSQMFFGALALIHAPLVVPLPSGGGGLEVAF